MVLFGGYNGSVFNAETWEWDGSMWTRRATTGPSERYFAGFAFDEIRGVCVGFGGAGSGTFGDTWEWDGTAWTNRAVAGPPARVNAAMSYDSSRHVSVLFGGADGNRNRLQDTWEWNGATWTQRSTTGPSPRWTHAMSFDSIRGVTVLFGGDVSARGGNLINDATTWEWNGTVWSQVIIPSPPARHNHAIAFDSSLGKTVLFGGHLGDFPNGAVFGDTWIYDGSAWVQLAPQHTPGGRSIIYSMAYSGPQHGTILFGGVRPGPQFLGDTWVFSSSPILAGQPQSLAVGPACVARLAVIAGGTGPFTYQWQWRPFGTTAWLNVINGLNTDPITGEPSFNGSGVTGAQLTMTNAVGTSTAVSGGRREIHVVVSNTCGAVTSSTATWRICPADFDCDGFVTGDDFDAYVAAFEAGVLAADFDQDGFVTGDDFDQYVVRFESGC